MDTGKLRKFASFARTSLIEQVGTRLKTVLAEKSLARRESPKVIEELEKKIKELGEQRVLETVAYTWFNRFCALRYMDVNRYTRIGVLSPADGQFQPEILAEAKMGHIDEELVPEATRKRVMRLLDGSDPSTDPQGESYRLLLVAVCNYYHALMPFMFEKIADFTELLLPDDLLSGTSIPAYTREALLPVNCSPEHTEESVEVIGWLYQFYIADKKDEVFDGLKKGKKISAENIPAATQLFTPHWIVRYLVENSLGRLWMLNHPNSKLTERMDYYIKPVEPETDFLTITSPEEIKICDPACGSGHMLTYAFDLLYEIYREEQYPEPEIPSLILKNNLYGIEIDPRAGALAAFALTMKAREKDKRFFTRKPQLDASARDSSSIQNPKSRIPNPNVCVLENIKIDSEDLSAYMDKVGRDLFTGGLQAVVTQWEESDNFGSLIRPLITDVSDILELLRERQMGQDLFLANVHQQVLKALRQADYLSPKYHVVVANPPYMGANGMNPHVKKAAQKYFPETKSDLFSMFAERVIEQTQVGGFIGLMTPFTWMFLSSHKGLRARLFEHCTLTSLVKPEYHAFFDSAYVPLCAFVLFARPLPDFPGTFIDLGEFYGVDLQPVKALEAIRDPNVSWRYSSSASDFMKIPGTPISFWVPDSNIFDGPCLGDEWMSGGRIKTHDGQRFLRFHWEVSYKTERWRPLIKGGDFRRFFGNEEYAVDWSTQAVEFYDDHGGLSPEEFRNKEGISWSKITSSHPSFRIKRPQFEYDSAAPVIFNRSKDCDLFVLAYLNSSVTTFLLNSLNPTLNTQLVDVLALPMPTKSQGANEIVDGVKRSIHAYQIDWNEAETSAEFSDSPLSALNSTTTTIRMVYERLRQRWKNRILEAKEFEDANNRFFVEQFNLCDVVNFATPIEDISLSCNPHQRYGSDKSESELEALLLAETMREFISYAVGCMLGRYSLDKPRLILANQGETAHDYFRLTILDFGLTGEYHPSRLEECMKECKFPPDLDNVIPILDGDWFNDDISQRFKEFLKVSFGTEHYDENLEFLENALYPDNPTAKKRKTVRDYFLKEFYDHHLKMYKKRPIYWLFSSPKGTFNALIYMHRYRPDTVSTVLDYLRDFRDKLFHHSEHQQMVADSGSASKTEKTAAIKEVAVIKKQLKELEDYEKDLFDVASKKIEIDLDNGVKHNYPLFGSVLKDFGLEILDS